ncbi:hypothetical protein PTSG_05343 [Salpingoeca rosetta]|uniref:Apple domain-containing protein n=1 Tax=Salpingoeca rosetta (strain ATCC 50818 / BSB-021) TaxID=946362 RepID=F2UA60_SALR5|nr:uncharacterized protein PTSG_05343 [Salpingoeca rosetta]EGD73635.1 hypothetical protein PTSG_05343 [Salpingoeca rosetta]|eukprot:XP_004993916.1 hypothetical protein PTSG_05343 [Salpingoeca rosetta]
MRSRVVVSGTVAAVLFGGLLVVVTVSSAADAADAATQGNKSSAEWIEHASSVGPMGLFDPTNPYDRLPPRGVDPDFECDWRKAAWKYAQKLQPSQPNLRAVFDALQLEQCGESLGGFRPAEPSSLSTFSLPAHASDANTFYVDAVAGSDSNPGTLAKPFRTVLRAVEATRGLPASLQPGTVALRGGVHRFDSTLHLGSSDSGLTLQNYNGEKAIITGALHLGELQWLPFNVTRGNVTWDVHQNTNAVYGAPSTHNASQPVYIYNKTATPEACEAACKNHPRCNVWTWHDSKQKGYELDCFFRTDGVWSTVQQTGHVSGHAYSTSMRQWGQSREGRNIWAAALPHPPAAITGLRVNGERAIRARYPDANPERDLFPKGWISAHTAWFGRLHGDLPQTNIVVDTPNRSFEQDEFQHFVLGIGGTCDSFTPPEGYWCSTNTSGGGAFTYRIPAGLQYSQQLLPHSHAYVNATGAIVQAWRPGHWASWMFEVDGFHPQNESFTWTRGGFQGARGSDSGAEWFIENVFEELDAPNEYYYDARKGALYLYYNGSVGTPPPASGVEATNLKVLISAVAAQADPITNLTIRGLHFRDGALTYMDPHGMPSGGDWGLQRTALVFLEGTEHALVQGCNFTRNDGIALMLSGYNRFATIRDNEIVLNGDSAIAAWGYTDRIDATGGAQPRLSTIANNFVHEMGLYEKQSSAWFQGKTAQTTLSGNIFFNGPRALINFNDGMGGANVVEDNLLFNSCRESSDHGPINSWDRQPFLTRVNTGEASLVPAYTTIGSNFVVANYGADGGCFDTDDGSSFYLVTSNFFVYGGHKSDFNGHNKRSEHNINAYPQVYGPRCLSVPLPDPKLGRQWSEGYSNCTCILADEGGVYLNIDNCDGVTPDTITLILGDNKVYAPNGKVTIQCGKSYTLSEWQAAGYDAGTTVHTAATSKDIIAWAHALLGF